MPSYTVSRGSESFVAPDFPTLRQWASQGRIRADDMVWSQGWPEKTKAYNISGLREIFMQRNERPSVSGSPPPGGSRGASGSPLPGGSREAGGRKGDLAQGRRPRAASAEGGLPSGGKKGAGQSLGRVVQDSLQDAAETLKRSLAQGLADSASSWFGGASKGRRKAVGVLGGGRGESKGLVGERTLEGKEEEDAPWLFLSASEYRASLPDPAEEPIRYRLQEGPFWLSDVATEAEIESYLQLSRHRDIERPSRILFAEYSPERFAPILVEQGILVAPERQPDTTEIGEFFEDFFGIESPPALFLAPGKASAFGVAGDEEESFLFVGKGLHEGLSRPQKAVALGLLYVRLYLMESRLRTTAHLAGDPILFRRLQIEPPWMQEAAFLSWLQQSDRLADRMVFAVFQDLGLIQSTYKVLAQAGSSAVGSLQTLQEYGASPVPALGSRLSALDRFAASPQAKAVIQKTLRSPIFPDLKRLLA